MNIEITKCPYPELEKIIHKYFFLGGFKQISPGEYYVCLKIPADDDHDNENMYLNDILLQSVDSEARSIDNIELLIPTTTSTPSVSSKMKYRVNKLEFISAIKENGYYIYYFTGKYIGGKKAC